ncbi:MAG: hypothetical protein ACREJM_03880 [Candidatus Saccharimonadales bacterium]
MHAQDFVELAALVADNSSGLIEAGHRLSDEALVQYWSASKCRLQCWSKSLKQLAAAGSAEIQPPHWLGSGGMTATDPLSATTINGLLAEILTSEVLTRVWAATATAHDRRRNAGDVEPIVRSVYAGHLEARNRTLVVLARGPGISTHHAVALNRLRRRAERWTDLLLGRVTLDADVSEFTFDAEVAREFAHDFRGQHTWQRGGQAWSLALASLRASFHDEPKTITGNEALNEQIAAAVLGCFGRELFDSAGLPLKHAAASSQADQQGTVDAFFVRQRPEINLASRARRLTDPR